MLNQLIDDEIPFVISQDRNFIWTKIPKVANTSIYKGNIKKQDNNAFNSKTNKKEIQKIVETQSDFSKYFSFTFVRNPWDRLVSCYTFLNGQANGNNTLAGMPFSKFVHEAINNPHEYYKLYEHMRPQLDFFAKNGNVFIEFIGRFENLQEDWNYVAQKIGMCTYLPIMNKSKNRLKYTEYYTPETIKMTRKYYEEEIDILKYTF